MADQNMRIVRSNKESRWPHGFMSERSVTSLRCPLLIMVLLWTISGNLSHLRGQTSEPFSAEKVQRILGVSRLAAQNGMQDLSLRAAREALGPGRPAVPDQQSSKEPLTPDQRRMKSDTSIQQTIHTLNLLWQEKEFDRVAVWETLLAIVLPADRPGEIFLYASPPVESTTTTMPGEAVPGEAVPGESVPGESVGRLLIQQSILLRKTDELRLQIENRLSHPDARVDAWHLLLQLAQMQEDFQEVRRRLQEFTPEMAGLAPPDSLPQICLRLLKSAANPRLRDVSLPALDLAMSRMSNTKGRLSDKLNQQISVLLFRDHLKRGDPSAALSSLHSLDSIMIAASGSANSPSLLDHHTTIANLLLQSELNEAAVERLNEIVALESEAAVESTRVTSRMTPLTPYLRQLSPEQRLPFLRYLYFGSNRHTPLVPLLTLNSKVESIPEPFKRKRGEPVAAGSDPNVGSEPKQDISRMRNLVVSSAQILIDAAVESGQTESLRSDLLRLQSQGVSSASQMLSLLSLQTGSVTEAQRTVQTVRQELSSTRSAPPGSNARQPGFDLLFAMRAAENSETRADAIEILSLLKASSADAVVRSAAAQAGAFANASEIPTALSVHQKSSPALWRSSRAVAEQDLTTAIQHGWLVHEDMLMHQPSPQEDAVYFPWPLAGTFEFSVSSLHDAVHGGLVGFNGLMHELLPEQSASVISAIGDLMSVRSSMQFSADGEFARRTVRVTPDEIIFLVNGHPIFRGPRVASSNPWLTLANSAHKRGVWRLPAITGAPQVLSEVRMSDDPKLHGWTIRDVADIQPNAAGPAAIPAGNYPASGTPSQAHNASSLNWSWNSGVILGQRNAEAAGRQSLLQYDRPLESGDSIRWEFAHSSTDTACHPALGSLAFLIRPEGVSLHWIAGERDNAGLLPDDNEVTVPADQRGEKVQLISGWNQAELQLQDNVLTLLINGVTNYVHTLTPKDSRRFGIFHFSDQTNAGVRNVVLKGNWPTVLSDQQLQQLFRPNSEHLTPAEHHIVDRMFGQNVFETTLPEIMRYFSTLPPKARYESLFKWVLPGATHSNWRTRAIMAPVTSPERDLSRASGRRSVPPRPVSGIQQPGGNLTGPVTQLINAAKEAGLLADLKARVDKIDVPNIAPDPGSSSNTIDQLCLQLLIAVEEGEIAEAIDFSERLRLRAEPGVLSEREASLLLLVCQEGLEMPALRTNVKEVLQRITKSPAMDQSSPWASLLHFAECLQARAELINEPGSDQRALENWQAFRIVRADQSEAGLPQPVWRPSDRDSVQFVSGFEDDMLCYGMPLTGDFELECELTSVRGEHLQVGYGGVYQIPASLQEDARRVPLGRDSVAIGKLNVVPDPEAVWKYHLTILAGEVTISINGQQILKDTLPPSPAPWLCVRATRAPGTIIRNVRLLGNPVVPTAVDLDTGPGLQGWGRPFFWNGEPFLPSSRAASDWHSNESVLIGPQRELLAETKSESLFQYARPMLEDGTIAYSFYYEPGLQMVHPAVDQLAFVLDAKLGVLLHPITNGLWDRTGRDPASTTAEPASNLVSALPLRENDWNTMQVTLVNDRVTLTLNDVAIFRRPLAPSHRRTFGMFYYKGEAQAKVRELTWHGQWPRQPAPPAGD